MTGSPPSPSKKILNRRNYNGPAFLKQGFRPFFLAAAIWSAVVMTIWLLYLLTGEEYFPFTPFTPHDWHMHEMLFGFMPAAITGFLLTAVPNWTGRLPVRGWPLGLLAGLWLAGRFAPFLSFSLGEGDSYIINTIDCSFLFALTLLLAREIIKGKNWRNLPVVAIIATLAIANMAFHLSPTFEGDDPLSSRIAFFALMLGVLLISLIGGRIVPSFTRNWLARHGTTSLPAPRDNIDQVGSALILFSALLLVFYPDLTMTGALGLITALVHFYRLSRWRGWSARSEALVLILHIGYGWIGVGFLLAGLSILVSDSIPFVAATHAFGAGAVGSMILAVMTRATRGHTSQPLEADLGTILVYALINLSALTRVLTALAEWGQTGYLLSGLLWIGAFALFSLLYLPLFVKG